MHWEQFYKEGFWLSIFHILDNFLSLMSDVKYQKIKEWLLYFLVIFCHNE